LKEGAAKRILLLGSDFPMEEFEGVAEHAEVHRLSELKDDELDALLPSVDCLLVQLWPGRLDRARVARMSRLSLVQSGLAGVNHVPFGALPGGVVVCSNAGGYSDEVAEFAWGLLLSAAKRIVRFDAAMRQKGFVRPPTPELGREVLVLKGRTLGVIGYGGIGRGVARIGRSFGMEVAALARRPAGEGEEAPGIAVLRGREGLERVLRDSDALVLAVPLNGSTRGMIGRAELSTMKRDAVLVNVARAEVVDEDAIYEHLVANAGFCYATDVWWAGADGEESYSPRRPLLELGNFIGTPHASGPSAVAGRGPLRAAVQNVLRYFRGEEVLNVVDRSEYA
jgi:glycerate dehydrogenase